MEKLIKLIIIVGFVVLIGQNVYLTIELNKTKKAAGEAAEWALKAYNMADDAASYASNAESYSSEAADYARDAYNEAYGVVCGYCPD